MSACHSRSNHQNGDVAGVIAARQSGILPVLRKDKRKQKFDYRCQVLCVPNVQQDGQCCASVYTNPVRC